MNNPKIKIPGHIIITHSSTNSKAAFQELGVEDYTKNFAKAYYANFEVDLDFLIRHSLITWEIYEEHYKNSEQWLKYFNEGKEKFKQMLSGKEDFTIEDYETPYGEDKNLSIREYPFRDGFYEEYDNYFIKKNHIDLFKKELKNLLTKYNLRFGINEERIIEICCSDGFVYDLNEINEINDRK